MGDSVATPAAPSALPARPAPERIPEIIAALRRVTPLHGLSDCEYLWLAEHARERFIDAGATLFHEGEPATAMTILLSGEVQVSRDGANSPAVFIGRAGQITGLLPFSRMKTYGGLGFTTADCWALEYDRSLFPEMLTAVPGLTPRVVSVLLDRVREVTRIEQQSEKLTALGKLAGNLAHELNNPASAAQRAASGMMDELNVFGQERFRLGTLCFKPEQIEALQQWEARFRAESRKTGSPSAAAVPGREDEIDQALHARGVESGWQMVPELAEQGLTPAHLASLPGFLTPEGVTNVLAQLASTLRIERIAEAMLDSTARIFDLIRAIKDYSYMDQAPVQDINVPQSLENTLAMFQSRLVGISVHREYEPNLPPLPAYAKELNQIWTALIENALDAMEPPGKLTLRVRCVAEMLVVEVIDNGVGIPAHLKSRIFEPFFTTKAPGRGLGLGLDVAQRIVRMHRGFIIVESQPGATCFQVRLPLKQLEAY